MKLKSTQELPAHALDVLNQMLKRKPPNITDEFVADIASWEPIVRESFFEALVNRLMEVEKPARVVELLGRFADEVMVIRITDIIVKVDDVPKNFPLFGLMDLLREVGTRGAKMELQRIAYSAKNPEVLMHARMAIQREADALVVRVWEIEDELVPDCGLNSDGPTFFTNGERKFQFKLGPGLEPTLVDTETFDRFFDLPEPSSATPHFIEQQRSWHVTKNHVEDVVPVQVDRLEQALALQFRWTQEAWEKLRANPIMRHMLQRAVWGEYRDTGRLLRTFRLLDDWSLAGPDDEPFELSPDTRVGLLHRTDLSNDDAEAWGALFADYEVVTLFSQLDRGVRRVPDEIKKETEYRAELKLPMQVAKAVLLQRGWTYEFQYRRLMFRKVFRHYDVLAAIRTHQSEPVFNLDYASFRRYLGYPESTFQLRDVPKAVFSEVMLDIDRLRDVAPGR